jgi:Ca2+-binding RTX toxin-like protein
VTWTDWGNDGSNRGVFAQLYDANGLPLGNEFQVNTWETNDQAASKVQGLPDGGFVIVWHSYGVGGIPNHDISGQRYDAASNKVDGEFIVNNPTGSDQTYPSIDIRDDGALVVVWQADGSRIEQKIITSLDSTATTKDLTGRPGNDSFLGSQLIDNLDGVGGDDRLAGLGGDDTIEGGPGSDTVVFNTASDGIDTIIGFVSGVDRLEISAVNFGHGHAAGGAAILVTAADIVSAFYAGANGYFIFDNDGADAGKVYWDENGDSGADAVAIAELLGVTSLLSSDIILA